MNEWSRAGASVPSPATSDLLQDLEPEGVLGIALQEQLQDLDALPAPARVEVDLGQRHVGHLESRVALQELLQEQDRAGRIAPGREDQGEVVGGLPVAGASLHRL